LRFIVGDETEIRRLAAAENLLKLKEKTKGDFQGEGLGSTVTYQESGVYILATSVSSQLWGYCRKVWFQILSDFLLISTDKSEF